LQTEQTGLKRHLKVRHIRLMALGSTIGVGLFLGSASAIQLAGPSILLGYLLAGIVAFIVLRTLGEMAVHDPVANRGLVAALNHDVHLRNGLNVHRGQLASEPVATAQRLDFVPAIELLAA